MPEGKRIFIATLDWGMGHATRMKPVIQRLSQNNHIILGVSSFNRFYFDEQFPQLEKVELPAYHIRYSKYLPVWLKIIFDWPRIKRVIRNEHQLLQTLIPQKSIDLVISDSRFGLYSAACHCIIVSHQLQLRTPFKKSLASKLNKKLLENFNEIWVPDFESRSLALAGELSAAHDFKVKVNYIGPQSSLLPDTQVDSAYKSDFVILLSGPEPQRTVLEDLLLKTLKYSDKKIILIRGTQKKLTGECGFFKVLDFCHPQEIAKCLQMTETVICRSGYSTLMDLYVLGKKKVILIPTPGQTEQEYLAKYWKENFDAVCLEQNQISNQLLTLIRTH